MIDYLYINMCIVQYNILQRICNRNVFTNFLPCSHTITPNNETCLVNCAVSLTCTTWLMYVCTVFLLDCPSASMYVYKVQYSTLQYLEFYCCTFKCYDLS